MAIRLSRTKISKLQKFEKDYLGNGFLTDKEGVEIMKYNKHKSKT